MPTITISTSVAANATSPNIFAGQLFEFLSRISVVKLSMSSAASAPQQTVNFTVGGAQEVADGTIPATARFPVVPDDNVAQAAGLPGDRLFATISNPTGAAIVTQTKLEILA